MGSRLRYTGVLAAALALLAPAFAEAAGSVRPQVRWVATKTNFTRADRPQTSIRWIVIHTTEGGFLGSVSWLRNPRARASAHYVVSQRGEIVQMVRDADIAWHAGNWLINRGSIGIEHEAWAGRASSLTPPMYRASARISAHLARSALMPIDRKHFIGHADVPDPNNARLKGGFSHHHDPGPHWNWAHYLSLVRAYARGASPPAYVNPIPKRPAPPRRAPAPRQPVAKTTTLSVETAWPRRNQVVTGFVPWHAAVVGRGIQRVDFLVDGKLRHTERRPPFAFGGDGSRWDTTRETNGIHVLTLRVVGAGGRMTASSTRVRVANTRFQVASTVASGQSLAGRVRWDALPKGGDPDRVEYVVDGRHVHTERSAPYTFEWDTRREQNGPHQLVLRAVSEEGEVAVVTLDVSVDNPVPPPPPPSPFRVVSQSLAEGQTVTGVVSWTAETEGTGIERVEFHVDGVLRWVDERPPYRFAGDGRWDTAKERPGRHDMVIAAVHRDGRRHSGGVTVVVPARAALSVASTLVEGSTLQSAARWEAKVTGPAPERVEFYVDGRLRHTERTAPYEYTWAADEEAAGLHTLTLRAVAAQERAEWSGAVRVEREPTRLAVTPDGIAAGTVQGRLTFRARVTGVAERVELWVDGTLRHTERSAPYDYTWDTTRERDGVHELALRAVHVDGTVAVAKLALTVANAVPAPTPAPTPAPAPPAAPAPPEPRLSVELGDGATVTGVLELEARLTGATTAPRRVELWVGRRRIQVEQTAPYEFRWDATEWRPGEYALVVRALWRDGSDARLERRVIVVRP